MSPATTSVAIVRTSNRLRQPIQFSSQSVGAVAVEKSRGLSCVERTERELAFETVTITKEHPLPSPIHVPSIFRTDYWSINFRYLRRIGRFCTTIPRATPRHRRPTSG